MKLYHGTSEATWRLIQAAGAIQPRNVHGVDNWRHSVSSRADAVYLTDTYAPYFAINTINERGADGQRVAIIEIESDRIAANLVPDEDAFEQATRPKGRKVGKLTMRERTKKIRRNLHRYIGTNQWGLSLSFLGTCAHIGPIPLTAITRVALINVQTHSDWAIEGINASITRANYAFCGRDYRAHLARSFDIGELEIM